MEVLQKTRVYDTNGINEAYHSNEAYLSNKDRLVGELPFKLKEFSLKSNCTLSKPLVIEKMKAYISDNFVQYQ